MITPTGDRMVFSVVSDSEPHKTYRVDLLAHGGRSECECRDWSTRRWPNIKQGLPAGSSPTLCKHVAATRQHFLNALLADMAATEQKQ